MNGHPCMAKLLKALAHPVRLQIVEVLHREGEACVCHLEHILNQRQAYISQQLSRLREAGLVVDRRKGLNVFYALADGCLVSLLEAAKRCAVKLAADQGAALEFPAWQPEALDPCCCPKCAASPA